MQNYNEKVNNESTTLITLNIFQVNNIYISQKIVIKSQA